MKAQLWNAEKGEYAIWCPGCNSFHALTTRAKNENGAQWRFNGNLESPTFTPSLDVDKNYPKSHCHSSITDGKIQFLEDCFHSLKGQRVELPDITDQ